MKSLILSMLCTVFFPLAAFGLEHPDLYVHGFGGANYLAVKKTDAFRIGVDAGYIVGLGVGFQFINTRIELEWTYRYNDYEEDVPLGPDVFFDGGHTEKITYFVNFFYDFPVNLFADYLRPYIGFGCGHRFDKEKVQIVTFLFAETMWTETIKYSDMGFGAQVIVGVGLPVSEHGVTKIEYRLLKDEEDVENHSFVLNMDWTF